MKELLQMDSGGLLNLPKRKPNRLKTFDYGQTGAYFITLCTKDRQALFWEVGARSARPDRLQELSGLGRVVEGAIQNISVCYPTVTVVQHCIMPNHIHLLMMIESDDGRAVRAPTISTIVNQMKGYVTKQVGVSVWQKSFYDHIVRNREDNEKVWNYIIENPYKWEEDYLYQDN